MVCFEMKENIPKSRNQMKNLFFIHADVTNANDPNVVLKFPRNHVEVLHVARLVAKSPI